MDPNKPDKHFTKKEKLSSTMTNLGFGQRMLQWLSQWNSGRGKEMKITK